MSQSWREIESRLVDGLKKQGVSIIEDRGVLYVADYYYDDDSGELLRTHHVVNIEELARRLALPD